MKNFLMVLVVLAVMFAASGCQGTTGFFNDVAGSAAWCAEKLEPASDKAAENDADRAARKLAKRQAILSAQISLARQNEVR